MDAAGRLFRRRRVYDEAGTEELFLRAMGENVKRHYARCPEYRAILDSAGFSPKELRRAISNYIETYNSLRPHEALDYATPDQVFFNSFTSDPAGLDRTALAC